MQNLCPFIILHFSLLNHSSMLSRRRLLGAFIGLSSPGVAFRFTSSPSLPMSTPRDIVKKFESVEQAEGAGARVRRSIGRPELRQLDPFLMLDEFKVGK